MAQPHHSSLLSWDIESEFSNFNDGLTVHPWDSLTKKICEALDENEFKRLVFVSREHLGVPSHIFHKENLGMEFFMALEKEYGKDVTEVLVNIFSHTGFHAQSGNLETQLLSWLQIICFYRNRAQDKVHVCISLMSISSPTPIFDHLLESSHRDDFYKWSNIGVGEEVAQVVSIEVNFTHLIWCHGANRIIWTLSKIIPFAI